MPSLACVHFCFLSLPFLLSSPKHKFPTPAVTLPSGTSIFQMVLVVILASTVVAMSAVAQLWEDEWEVLLISLQVSEAG